MLPFLFLPQLPGPLGPATPLPPALPVRLEAAETWRIRPVAPSRREPDEIKVRSLAVTVDGRRVVIGPKGEYGYVDGVGRGRDGSLLVRRTNRGAERWEWRADVWYRGKETPADALVYLDRRNYASYFVRERGPGEVGLDLTAPETTAVRDGKPVSLGWGWPQAWTPEGAIVLKVPVDHVGKPSGTEFTTGWLTRILTRTGEWRVRDYRLLGRMADGTLALVAGPVSSLSSDPTDARVLLWRNGRFVAHVMLPSRWWVGGLAPEGWILVRRRPEPKSSPPIPLAGRRAEDIVADFERRATSDDALEIRAERDWTAGMLKGGTLTPIAFAKPTGAERLLWRDGATLYGARAFRFMAFWGREERHFRVAPR